MATKKQTRLYAIAVIDSQYLRDYKLRALSGDVESDQPDYDKLLRIYGNWASPVLVRPFTCRILGKTVRKKLSGATRWKTRAGCEKALSRIEASAVAKTNLARKMQGAYQFHVVDITDCWNDTVSSEMEYERRSYESRMSRLQKKLIKTDQ